jgi:predicted DNA-binding transcriptional regulator AlpA
MAPDEDDPLLTYRQMSEMTGLTINTLRSYKRYALLPSPDDVSVPDRPRWRASTIRHWMENRRGRGTRTDLIRKREEASREATDDSEESDQAACNRPSAARLATVVV